MQIQNILKNHIVCIVFKDVQHFNRTQVYIGYF